MSNQVSVREQKMMDLMALEGVKNQLSNLLDKNPRKMEAFKTRMLKVSLSYGLDKCSPESLINCGLQALTLNLPLEAGQGYIVNYGGTACFDAGYKGWQILAKRAGYAVLADTVYACDEFRQEGFGFNSEMIFEPNFDERQAANDQWAKSNLRGVIVSIFEQETKLKTVSFVQADMIHKIVGTSPSQKSEKGKQYSPHENWADQMFRAKAIKQVLSKFPIDIATSQLTEAIEITNVTESNAQAQQPKSYPQERFDENYPKWVQLVETRKKTAAAIITQLSNGFQLTEQQMNKVIELRSHEPIDAEVENA